MKKSKIIVPSLGILLLSAAASISGTVAWFTANRTFEMDAGSFSVISTKTNLECVVTGGVGTMVGANKAIQLDTELNSGNLKLTDASVDVDEGKLIAPDYSGRKAGKLVTLADANNGYNSSAAAYQADYADGLYRESYDESGTPVMVFSAFTFELDFSIAFGSTGSDQALFFDLATSTATASAGDNTSKGFRMAFIPETIEAQTDHDDGTGVAKVWAPFRSLNDVHDGAQTEGADTPEDTTDDVYAQVKDLRYIDCSSIVTTVGNTQSVLAEKEADYDTSANVLMTEDDTDAAPTDGSGADTDVNYLGTFDFTPSTTIHLKYLVFVWFEGTDPMIVNNAQTVYETVTTHLVFGSDTIE